MNLEDAILLVPSASPRAIPAAVILGFVSTFTGKHETIADITAALHRLKRKGRIKGAADEERGICWIETGEGRLRARLKRPPKGCHARA